jgi:hypothetical protein
MTFECEEHRLFYEQLQKQIKEGICPSTQEASERLGFPRRHLHHKKNKPWKVQIADAYKNAASKWRNDGRSPTAKKFEEELQAIVNAEEEPIGTVLCQRVGVSDTYIANPASPWAIKIKQKLDKARIDWKKHGGKDYKELKIAFNRIVKDGERPFASQVAIRGGKYHSYFYSGFLFSWKIKLIKEIEKADLMWQENGGSDYKKLKKALKEVISKGLKPTINSVSKEAIYKVQNLNKPKFPWHDKIVSEVKKAKQEWEKDGGVSYEKCKNALIEIIREDEIPTPRKVSVRAGFSNVFLTTWDTPWKQKIRKEIEIFSLDGMIELKILFVNLKTLIHSVVEEEKDLGNYHNLGIYVNHPILDEVRKYNLSHIMYGVHRLVRCSQQNKKVFIEQASYNENRKLYIEGILFAIEGMTYSNMESYIPRMIEAAVWLGDNIPSNINEAKQAFMNYSERLHKMLKSDEIKHHVAKLRQSAMSKLVAGMFRVDESKIIEDLTANIIPQKAPKSNAFNNCTQFTQQELGYAFAFYFHLFDQLADFLLENKPYPNTIKLLRGNATILGVAQTMIAPDYEPPKSGSIVIDYSDGHILTEEEIEKIVTLVPIEKQGIIRTDYKRTKEKVLNNLIELNSTPNHDKRLQLGKKALDAWFMCMIFLTLTNDSTLARYEWSENDEYETEHDERKEFVTIKPRAQNKNIRFTIPKAFMPSFQKAIKLRRFVLDGHDFPYLFFASGYGTNARATKMQFGGGMSSAIASQIIESLDSELPRVCSRSPRKDGAKDALESHGVEVALAVLQNEEDTLINNYNGYTAEELASQVGGLMQNIHDNIVSKKPIDEKHKSAMGGCDCEDELKPETFSEKSPVNANCLDQKTCIFCIHYITFPEPEEIRKLLSLHYLIENTAYDRTEDEAFYEKEMKPWLKRIEVILNQMVEEEPKAEEMIKMMKIEVYEDSLLSPYWLDWVVDLDELGRFA